MGGSGCVSSPVVQQRGWSSEPAKVLLLGPLEHVDEFAVFDSIESRR
jgi:hypothetical protein